MRRRYRRAAFVEESRSPRRSSGGRNRAGWRRRCRSSDRIGQSGSYIARNSIDWESISTITIPMLSPLATADYDHVIVLDTNVVLEANPLDQLPWDEAFPGSVLLVIPRQVQSEIDAKKNDGRLGTRARAFNRLLDDFIESRVPSTVLSEPKIDVATMSNRRIDWDNLDDLDRDDPDDRIIAQSLNALVDDPSRLTLLSYDMRPRDAARNHGLSAMKLPESWLREPEPSPEQRRINRLEGELKLLSADQPQLSVRLETVTAEPWQYREVTEATTEQIRRILEGQFAKAPRRQDSGPLSMAMGNYDYSHDGRLSSWKTKMREEIPLMHQGLSRLFAQHRVLVTVENEGSISAESLSLEIRSGNTVLHSLSYWVLISGPPAPHPRPHHHLFQDFNANNFLPPRREPFNFYWDERGPGDHLILSCASFRQEKAHQVEISVELLANSAPKAQIEAIVTASNMKGDSRDRLLVEIEDVEVPFDDAYSVEQAIIKLQPPFVLAGDVEEYDYTSFLNTGLEYERT